MKSFDLVSRSDYDPAMCLERLAGQIDVDRWAVSLSGYQGNKPILGRISGNEFRLHKRRYWHNSFGPVLYGRMISQGGGTVVEAYWDTRRVTRIALRVWLIFAALISTPIFLKTLQQSIRDKSMIRDNLWLGLIVPLFLVSWGILLPRIGSALSFHERRPIVELLQRTLMLGQTGAPKKERDWRSSLW
jgi:hypothetical protein